MEEPRIKAYGFVATCEFVEKNYDDAARKRIFGALSPPTRAFLEIAKKQQWASPSYSAELWTAIVKEHPPDQAADQLVKVGRYMGAFATNTYLKLLMKMLTVKMFAKKFPDIWQRDANFGRVELGDLAEIGDGKLTIHFKDLNWAYFGPICNGWFSFSLETMGLKGLKVETANWSIQNPDPGELTYRVSWTR
jgi:hypothetical protein